jgi:hypothetical protein
MRSQRREGRTRKSSRKPGRRRRRIARAARLSMQRRSECGPNNAVQAQFFLSGCKVRSACSDFLHSSLAFVSARSSIAMYICGKLSECIPFNFLPRFSPFNSLSISLLFHSLYILQLAPVPPRSIPNKQLLVCLGFNRSMDAPSEGSIIIFSFVYVVSIRK